MATKHLEGQRIHWVVRQSVVRADVWGKRTSRKTGGETERHRVMLAPSIEEGELYVSDGPAPF